MFVRGIAISREFLGFGSGKRKNESSKANRSAGQTILTVGKERGARTNMDKIEETGRLAAKKSSGRRSLVHHTKEDSNEKKKR